MAPFKIDLPQRRFLFSLLVFWAPILVLFAVEETVFYRSGETWTIEHVLSYQHNHPDSLFMRRLFDQQLYLYKLKEARRRRPEILALGSSRVMQFRAGMFGADWQRFYNAGGMLQCIEDLTFVLQEMPDLKPRVVLLGIDMWWLNEDWDKADKGNSDRFTARPTDAAISWEAHLLALRRLWLKEGSGLRLWKPYLNVTLSPADDRIGLTAHLGDRGFRATDGSVAYPASATPDRQFPAPLDPTHLQSVARGLKEFLPTGGVSARLLNELRDDLLELKRRGVLVVGFLPPFSSDMVRALESNADQREIWHQYTERVPALFSELRLPCIDASAPEKIGLTDRYMIDGVHAMETFHLHLLRAMLNDPRVAGELAATRTAIQFALSSPKTNVWYADLPPAGRPSQ
jgi:hypothetical protein